MRPKEPRVGDKGEKSVNSAAQGTQSGRQGGDKCKLMRPKAPRVRDKCGRQGGNKCKLMRPKEPRVGDKWETSVNSCAHGTQRGRQGGDKCKLMRPKAPRVGDKEGASVNSRGPRHPEWETSVGDKCGRQV